MSITHKQTKLDNNFTKL